MEPVPNDVRLKKMSYYLMEEFTTHFTYIGDEGEPYLSRRLHAVDSTNFYELQVECRGERFDIWLRWVKVGKTKPCQRGFEVEVEREYPVAKDVMPDTSLIGHVLTSFIRRNPSSDDLEEVLGIDPKASNEPAVKQIPPREYGLLADIERDEEEDNASFVSVMDPDDHSLLVVVSPFEDNKHLVGVDLFYNKVDLGFWREDGEWEVVFSTDLNGTPQLL